MADLISVADEAGMEIVINLDFVVRIQPQSDNAKMSVITIADGTNTYDFLAHGTPEWIASSRRHFESDDD